MSALYTVVKGDTLSEIATKFKMTVSTLKTLNSLKSDVIQIGQELKVSGGVTPSPTKPTQGIYKVFIDPGHGGKDPGAVAFGLKEKDMNLVVSFEMERILEAHGVQVRLSRRDDRYIDLDKRPVDANAWGADIMVSVHFNAGGGDGVEAIHKVYSNESEALAETLIAEIKAEMTQKVRARGAYTKTTSRGTDYFAVIRGAKMPCVIIEPAFIDSEDRLQYDTVEEQKRVGRVMAYGILKHAKISVNSDAQPVKEAVKVTQPVQPAKPVVTPSSGTHKVVAGDTLSKIAVKYRTTVDAITELNNLRTTVIQINQVLKVAKTPMVVKPAPTTRTGTVSPSPLNIRTGPGTSYKVIDTLAVGEKVTIHGSTKGWYRISVDKKLSASGFAYASSSYIK